MADAKSNRLLASARHAGNEIHGMTAEKNNNNQLVVSIRNQRNPWAHSTTLPTYRPGKVAPLVSQTFPLSSYLTSDRAHRTRFVCRSTQCRTGVRVTPARPGNVGMNPGIPLQDPPRTNAILGVIIPGVCMTILKWVMRGSWTRFLRVMEIPGMFEGAL